MTMIAHRQKFFKFPQAVELPRLSQTSVALNNLLAQKSQRLHFTVDQEYSHQIKLIPWIKQQKSSQNTKRKKQYGLNLSLDIGGTAAMLSLSQWPLAQRMQEYTPNARLQQMPTELQTALMEVVLEPFLQRLEHALNTTVRIGRLATTAQQIAATQQLLTHHLVLGFELQETHHETETIKDIAGIIRFDEKFLPALKQSFATWPSIKHSPWEAHHSPVWPELASVTLSRTELRELELSDIILLGIPVTQDEISYLRLRLASNLYCAAELEENYLTIIKLGDTMSEDMHEQNEDENLLNLDEIPVRLSFDLGEETLPFQELKTLTPGYTFELHRPYKEAVQIRSQNRLMGKGELVDVNGQIGVRITSIFNSGNKK